MVPRQRKLKWLVSLDNTHKDNDNSDDEQEMDETMERIGGNDPQQPEQNQNDSDCVQHTPPPSIDKIPYGMEPNDTWPSQ